MSINPIKKIPSLLGGIMIIAGTAIGAGMFSIPIVTAGVWFNGSVFLLIYTWACMLISGLMILEVNLHYSVGASFYRMTKDLLGRIWSCINGLSIAFVLYILIYAYISAGSSIIFHTFSGIFNVSQSASGMCFSVVVAFIVWLSTRMVDRLSTFLIGAMVITFILSVGQLFFRVETAILFPQNIEPTQYLPYALISLPYLLSSFGYHGNVPGLVKYYHKNSDCVVKSLFFGTLIALIIYLIWQYVIQGNIPRESFKQVITEGGNISSLLKQIDSFSDTDITRQLLNAFSYMALVGSFLGVSLGLFDYISDFFSFSDDSWGRTKSALVTFLPPTVAAFFFPDGFLYAIGFAGLAATLWAVIIPALMVRASRLRFKKSVYQAPGGKIMIYFIIFFGLINAVSQILSLAGVLPIYQ